MMHIVCDISPGLIHYLTAAQCPELHLSPK